MNWCPIGPEYCEVEDSTNMVNGPDENGTEVTVSSTYTRRAHSQVMFYTGGKALPKKDLFEINASAHEVLPPRAHPPYWYYSANDEMVIPWPTEQNRVDFRQVKVGELGTLDTNGRLYKALANNTTYVVTPTVMNSNFYNFGVSAVRRPLKITANYGAINEETSAPLCAPGIVYLEAAFDGTLDGNSAGGVSAAGSVSGQWAVSNTFVPQDSMTINQSLSANRYGNTYSLSGAWSDLGEKKITTTVNLTFDEHNGGEVHTESVSASGLVKVVKAQVSPTNQYLYVCPGDATNLTNCLTRDSTTNVNWSLTSAMYGTVGWTQSGSVTTYSNSVGEYTFSVTTKEAGCSSALEAGLEVIGIFSLGPTNGLEPWTNVPSDTYVVGVVPTNSPLTNLIVVAAPYPFVDESNLPASWVMSGASNVLVTNANGILTNSRIMRAVDRTKLGTNTIICKAGCLSQTNIVIVEAPKMTLKTNIVFVNSDDDNGNGVPDKDEPLSGAQSFVTSENDLVKLTLEIGCPGGTNETVTLNVPVAGVRVWGLPQRGTNAPLINSPGSTSWALGQMPSNVWVEGVSASAQQNGMQVTLNTQHGSTTTNLFTVVDVSVVLTNATSPLTNNTALGGVGSGLAIFPDKPTPTSTGDFSAVKVVATVTPAISNITVYFHAFDVDDPSSTSAPVDDETTIADNRGVSADGSFNVTALTLTNGTCSTNFHVSMQPGDNFRIVASVISNFYGQCAAAQTNDHGALVWQNSTNEIPTAYTSDMLTVWRRLHVEVDSMGAVTSNYVTGNITGISGSSSAATNLTLSVNLRTGLTPADNSTNRSDTPPGNGRFENGYIVIGTNSVKTTNTVTANGDTFVVGTSFSIPAQIATNNATNSVGQVIALNNAIFTVSSSLGTNKYTGWTLQIMGSVFTITTNTANTITVSGTPTLPFLLHDDDNDTILPHLPQIAAEVTNLYTAAYIRPVVDGGGDLANNAINVAFVANVNQNAIPSVMQSANALQSTASRTAEFWCAYVLMAYQFSATSEQVGLYGAGNPPRGDTDPNAEANIPGINYSPYGAIIFWECFRECGITSSEERTIAHEMAHQFGVDDTYTQGTSPPDDIMGAGTYSSGSRFYPTAINVLRTRTSSPGN